MKEVQKESVFSPVNARLRAKEPLGRADRSLSDNLM
jgi:hypothetical protein